MGKLEIFKRPFCSMEETRDTKNEGEFEQRELKKYII